MLGIPTVKDRMIQQAIHQEINRYYEPWFSEHSYGFRPGRNAHQAIRQASAYIAEGKEWVVDIDLEKFFDKINHDRLMQRLSKGIGDKRLLRLINAYLKAGMMSDGLMEQRVAGTPQGSPLSPLLSNIVLDELDRELESRGLSFCRYADDCNIFVRSRKAGERVLNSLTNFIEEKLKLKVNLNKSGVRHCSEVKFLGYTIIQEGKIRVADKTIERFKSKVKELTKRNRGVKFEQIVKELNVMITGWANYFHLANCWLSSIKELDRWIRRKLRCYRLKQCGRKHTIVKLLQSMGIAKTTSWNIAMYSQGWWAMSNKMAVNKAMGLKWFSQMGLRSLQTSMGFR
jgi:group II intron reverse transcriptase/maturase